MIEISRTRVTGFDEAIRGARNSHRSWSKSDSRWDDFAATGYSFFKMGENDRSLLLRLARAGSDEAKYRRMIVVYADINAPLYWWKQYDTYKVGTVTLSTSTMHNIADTEFDEFDFSFDDVDEESIELILHKLNSLRNNYIDSKSTYDWYQLIRFLPSAYNQVRTVMLNYEVLANIYHSRKNHKLFEWHAFCEWIEALPYSEIITEDRKA